MAGTLSQKIGFIGAGRMATALAKGIVHAGVADPEQLLASDASSDALSHFETATPGAATYGDNAKVAEQADVLMLAVKPQVMPSVLAQLRGAVRSETLLVSIAAGVTLAKLSGAMKRGTRIIRVMPNTPCLIGRGASAFAVGETATPEDAQTVTALLSAVGDAYQVPESQLDAVTGLSGSGPAFVYTAIEALTDAGVAAGLPRAVAAQLAARTVGGAAEMVLSTGEHPAVLRDQVTSPGGTTAAGLAALDRWGMRHALAAAVAAATARSKELGEID